MNNLSALAGPWLSGLMGARGPMLDERRDRVVAGRAGAVLWVIASLVVLALALLFDDVIIRVQWLVLLNSIAGVVIAGAALLWLDFRRWGAPLYVTTAILSLVVLAVCEYATARTDASADVLLLLTVVYSAYFFTPRVALLFVAAAWVIQLIPFAENPGAAFDDELFLAQLVVALPIDLALALVVASGKQEMQRHRRRGEARAREQVALRAVALTAVAGRDVFPVAAEQIGTALLVDGAAIVRLEGDEAVVLGSWSNRGTRLKVGQRVARDDESTMAGLLGYAASATAGIRVGDELWGAVAIAAREGTRMSPNARARLTELSEVLALAIVDAEHRSQLEVDASTDTLTGLLNHGAFHDRLRSEIARAQRHGRPLTVAIVDVDHFKEINDAGGHAQGDRVLAGVAARLRQCARAEDLLARIGGDEFAVLLPESEAHDARAALDRARTLVAAEPVADALRVTLSVGICELGGVADADELLVRADRALYWVKAHGRDGSFVYDPKIVDDPHGREEAARLGRSQALAGLRALARAIDAKDPGTLQHSERVAAMAAALAGARGWRADRVRMLHQAALVHDVGKIGIPDALLLKPDRLRPDEYEVVKAHAALGAQIVQDVLSTEQAGWIRAHHERADGAGYPDGLDATSLPEGAALLAIADAFDAMVFARRYSAARTPADAVAEAATLRDRQFTAAAVDALMALDADGLLLPAGAGASISVP